MREALRGAVRDALRAPWQSSAVRFLVVGVSNTLLSLVLFSTFMHVLPAFSLRAGVSQGLTYAIGTWWSYAWNRRWTFQSRAKLGHEALRFFGLQAALGLLSSLLISAAVDREHLPATLSWFVVMAGITVLNFVLSKYWAFRAR